MTTAACIDLDSLAFGARQRLARHIAAAADAASMALIGEFRLARQRLNVGPLFIGSAAWFRLPAWVCCPECGGRVGATLTPQEGRWGAPLRTGNPVFCIDDADERHRARTTDTAPIGAHDYLPVTWSRTWSLANEWIFHNVRVTP